MWFIHHTLVWKRRLFLLLLVAVSIFIGIPGFYLFHQTKILLTEETQDKAIDIATSIAAFLIYDIENYRMLSEQATLEDGSETERYYQATCAILRTIKEQSGADFIFTGRYVDDETGAYILDGEPMGSELFSPFGSTDKMNPTELKVYQSAKSMASNVEVDPQWGSFLTGYAPIIDPRDQTLVGLVGVDYSADALSLQLRRLALAFWSILALLVLVSTFALEMLITIIYERTATDDLTKLGNKRSFNKTLAALMHDAARYNNPFVLFMLDIDAFKAINDVYGHLVGDTVLVAIAQSLVHTTRTKQGCFRYGGDEFAILMPSTTLQDAERIRNAIEHEVASLVVAELGDQRLSVSIGIAQWNASCTAASLVQASDTDLYAQKRKGTR